MKNVLEQISMKNIVLIGMPGCGKTTIGELVGKHLNREYIDTDEIIEKNAEATIPDIFKNHGEPYFRELESKAAQLAATYKNKVIATGGGMILKESNMKVLKENGIIIFIDRPLEHLFSDIDEESRPLLKDNRSHLYKLYEERYPLYMAFADYHILNNQTIDEVVLEIETFLDRSENK